MIFGYFTLLVALTISAVAAYYSIVGLTAIFAAAAIPIIIMGAALEIGKITAAVWLKLYWARSRWTYKLYLVPAVTFLMVLTSMGIFGFLSKAHLDQGIPTGDIQAQVQIIDDKIKTQKDNIEASRRALKQMDESVDQLMARSTTEQGAGRSAQLRRSQQKERAQLQADIAQAQKVIVKLQEERAPIASQARKIEAEVGPIKYVAALIYGDNPDANLLERSVRWMIILIVMVFDPLALVLILAAQQSIRWARQDREAAAEESKPEPIKSIEPVVEPAAPAVETALADTSKQPIEPEAKAEPYRDIDFTDAVSGPVIKEERLNLELLPIESKPEEPESDEHKQMEIPFDSLPDPIAEPKLSTQIVELKPIAEDPPLVFVADVTMPEPIPEPATVASEPPATKIPEARRAYKAPTAPVPETININREIAAQADIPLGIQADNVALPSLPKSGFGTAFPTGANKGDVFLRVDQLPNRLFKFNGSMWIEVDKTATDSYSYDEQYVMFLVEKLVSGEYDIDQLSAEEQELVTQKLKEIADDKAKNIDTTSN